MSDRYWVGGTGSWDDGALTHWSTSSGGSGGASQPTSADNVFFDANSGGGITTIFGASPKNCLNLTTTGYTGSAHGNGSYSILNVFGSLVMGAGLSFGVSNMNFAATTPGQTITTNGVVICGDITFNGIGGAWSLQDNVTLGSVGSGFGVSTVRLLGGHLDLNGKTIATRRFYSTGTQARSLTGIGGAINIAATSGGTDDILAGRFVASGSGMGWNGITNFAVVQTTNEHANGDMTMSGIAGTRAAIVLTGSGVFNMDVSGVLGSLNVAGYGGTLADTSTKINSRLRGCPAC